MDAKAEIACTYASLILADDDLEVTADRLNTLLKAANCKFVEGYLVNLFASALSGRNVRDILSASSVAAAAAPAAAPVTQAASSAPAKVATAPAQKEEEEKKKEESEESEGDMGFDLFG